MNTKIARFFWMALWMGLILAFMMCQPMTAYGEDRNPKYNIPEGVYIDLTKDFYEALKNEGGAGSRVYSNDMSTEYLKQISISTRFMVETNLQILKQQERMMHMLQNLLNKRGK
ncbi:MAG: hypothetical protein JRJ85_15990 [Deltaproteobacteria bacterium]|nr:hypothetical protein [Deltaproteobacteria bacterium]